MTITSAYPLMYASCTAKVKLSSTTTAAAAAAADTAEQAKLRAEAVGRIKATMRERNTVLVGWYHSHVRSSPHPTVLDVKRQLRYQKEFLVSPNSSSPVKGGKGGSGLPASDYSPVVGLIVSPYYPRTARLVSLMQMFWVAPIYVSAVKDFGRPMQFHYTVTRDAFLTQDLLVEMVSEFSRRKNRVSIFIQFRTEVLMMILFSITLASRGHPLLQEGRLCALPREVPRRRHLLGEAARVDEAEAAPRSNRVRLQ